MLVVVFRTLLGLLLVARWSALANTPVTLNSLYNSKEAWEQAVQGQGYQFTKETFDDLGVDLAVPVDGQTVLPHFYASKVGNLWIWPRRRVTTVTINGAGYEGEEVTTLPQWDYVNKEFTPPAGSGPAAGPLPDDSDYICFSSIQEEINIVFPESVKAFGFQWTTPPSSGIGPGRNAPLPTEGNAPLPCCSYDWPAPLIFSEWPAEARTEAFGCCYPSNQFEDDPLFSAPLYQPSGPFMGPGPVPPKISFTASLNVGIPDNGAWYEAGAWGSEQEGWFGVIFDNVDKKNPKHTMVTLVPHAQFRNQALSPDSYYSFCLDNLQYATEEQDVPAQGDQLERVTVRENGYCLTVDMENAEYTATGDFDYAPVVARVCVGSDAQKFAYDSETPKWVLRIDSVANSFEGNTLCLNHGTTHAPAVVATPCAPNGINPSNAPGLQWQVDHDTRFQTLVFDSASNSVDKCLTMGDLVNPSEHHEFEIVTAECPEYNDGDDETSTNLKQMFDYTGFVREPLINFATALREVDVDLMKATPTPSKNQIDFTYVYGGPIPEKAPTASTDQLGNHFKSTTEFFFLIYPYGCNGIVDYDESGIPVRITNPAGPAAPSGIDHPLVGYNADGTPDASKAISLAIDGFDFDDAGLVKVRLNIDLETIEDSEFWQQAADSQTSANLKFCARLEIDYLGSHVNFHEINFDGTVQLKQGFELTGYTVNMDRAEIMNAKPNVSVDYPVEVKFCADDGTIIETPPSVVTQGFPIQLCVYLKSSNGGTIPGDVYVLDIDEFQYWGETTAGAKPQGVSWAVDSGVPDVITELDCKKKIGLCRIKFVPLSKYFKTQGELTLKVTGYAVIAFGTDGTSTRRLRVPVDAALNLDEQESRKLQEEVDVGGVSRIDFEVANMKASNPRRKRNKRSGAYKPSAYVACMVPLLAAAFAVWF